MWAVPEKVLNWLVSVLNSEYHDVNRTYSDVAEALSTYPSLSPRTEVYTFENGSSALLLLISGTIPVLFRGTTYRFPIAIWVPHAYPRESPIIYVAPAQGMLVRPGQHVAGDGRVYHPYLAGWSKFYDKSSISDFLQVLRGVFAKEPPVISAQQVQSPPPQQAAPPPVPPPPDEWRRSQQPPPVGVGESEPDLSRPPPVPPKPGESPQQQPAIVNGRAPPPHQGLPAHPLPPLRISNGSLQTPGVQGPGPITPLQRYVPLPNRQSTLGSEPSPFTPNQLPQIRRLSRTVTDSPVSPVTPDSNQRQASRYDQPAPLPPQQPQYQRQPPYPQYADPPPIQGFPPAYRHPQQQQQYSYQQPPVPSITKPKQPALDLLTSPLDVTLPSQTGAQTQPPVPPVPPNPEKDALLHALSQTLVAQTRQTLDSNAAAIAPLTAQHNALLTAQATLQHELSALSELQSAISANENLLRDAMVQADGVIRDAAGRQRPNIDDVLVPPFVAHKQVYEVVAEGKACEDARAALGRALDKGRVGVETWVRQMRAVGREEFLKKASARKIGVGLGLDVGSAGWGE